MNTVKTTDGIHIFYKDWGSGQPIVFSHGWPLSADDWDAQMMFFLNHGFRVIAHDRRGHGRSTQTADGHDMDHYADDLATVTAHLDLRNAIHVGHSTGGGEVVRYLARHGESRVAKAVLISAVPPLMVKTATNPGGLPKDVFDGFQAQVANNRSQFYRDVAAGPFYGYNRPGAKAAEGVTLEEIPAMTAVMLQYQGPYEGSNNAWTAVMEWTTKNGYEKTGPPMEVYLKGPMDVKDAKEFLTEIRVPVRKAEAKTGEKPATPSK